MKKAMPTAALALLGAAALRRDLAVRRYAVRTSKLFAPVRLAVLSDLHSGFYGAGQRHLLAAIEREAPDALLLAGDMADDRRPPDGAVCLVSAAAAAYPCFYVTGNHEIRNGRGAELRGLFAALGATVLSGSSAELALPGGQRLRICGLDDPTALPAVVWQRQMDALRPAPGDPLFSVLLTHRPERPQAYHGFGLVVAGHAHGGQVRIPGVLNGLFAPQQGWLPAYAGGLYPLDGGVMAVSRGLCRNALPRFWNRPELVIVDVLPRL